MREPSGPPELVQVLPDSSSPLGPGELARLVDAAAVGLWSYDAQLRFTYVNASAAEALGRPSTELLGRPISEVHLEEDLPDLERRIARRRSGVTERYEQRVRRPDGSVRWLAVAAIPSFEQDGSFAGVSGLLIDVTERHRATEQVRVQTTALLSSANAIVVTDANARVEWANPAFAALTGYALDEVAGRDMSILKSGVHPPGFYQELWSTVKAGRIWQGQLVNRRADGTLYEEEMTISPVAAAGGAPTHFIAVKQDVTARNQTAQQLREQAEILSMAHDAIIVQELDGRIRLWNQGASRILGWSKAEAVGRQLEELVPAPGGALLRRARESVALTGELTQDLSVCTRDGEPRTLASRWSTIRDGSGSPSGILCAAYDVTETRRLQAEAARAQRLESLGHLAGGIAHDLNNILVPIYSAAEDLRKEGLSSYGREALEDLDVASRSAGDLVKQVLAFARGSSEVRARVVLGELLVSSKRLLRRAFPHSVQLVYDWPDDLWNVLGDAAQLHQVLLNLCINARDALPNGGSIRVSATNLDLDRRQAALAGGMAPGRYVALSVGDDGTGIPQELLPHIFEPFFTTKARGRGTGIGLSTVQRVVHGHGGRVVVQSALGLGTEFRVFLPAMGSTQVQAEQPLASPRWHGLTAVVADDEPLVREAITRALEAAGFRVVEAHDGAEALFHFASTGSDVDLLVTNYWMPGMDGGAIIEHLRNTRPALPVLLVTGELLDERLPPLGTGEVLRKPFSSAELVAAVARLLPRAA